jgi:hypothetical protein
MKMNVLVFLAILFFMSSCSSERHNEDFLSVKIDIPINYPPYLKGGDVIKNQVYASLGYGSVFLLSEHFMNGYEDSVFFSVIGLDNSNERYSIYKFMNGNIYKIKFQLSFEAFGTLDSVLLPADTVWVGSPQQNRFSDECEVFFKKIGDPDFAYSNMKLDSLPKPFFFPKHKFNGSQLDVIDDFSFYRALSNHEYVFAQKIDGTAELKLVSLPRGWFNENSKVCSRNKMNDEINFIVSMDIPIFERKYYLVVNGCGFSPVFSSNGYEVSLDPFL